jgi:hypothetical protein
VLTKSYILHLGLPANKAKKTEEEGVDLENGSVENAEGNTGGGNPLDYTGPTFVRRERFGLVKLLFLN